MTGDFDVQHKYLTMDNDDPFSAHSDYLKYNIVLMNKKITVI